MIPWCAKRQINQNTLSQTGPHPHRDKNNCLKRSKPGTNDGTICQFSTQRQY